MDWLQVVTDVQLSYEAKSVITPSLTFLLSSRIMYDGTTVAP